MSGTIPSNADEPDDGDGTDGPDRGKSDAAGARADGSASTGSSTVAPESTTPATESTTPATESTTPATESTTDSGEAATAGVDGVAPETDARSTDSASPPADLETVSADATGTEQAARAGREESVRICWLDDDSADDLIGALAPKTARAILGAVHEEPQTASELADAADTSVQNVRHHTQKLVDAELIESVDTRYSVKGREMTVYGPADDRVVVAVGGESERSSLLDSLRGLLGAGAVLAAASLLVESVFGAGVASLSGPETAPRIGDAVGTTGGAVLGTLSPGTAFLAGGLLVLATVFAAERVRGR